MPVKIPQSLRTMLEDKAYGHVVTFNAQSKPKSQWFGWTSRVTRYFSTPMRDDANLTTYVARVIISVQDRNHPQAYAVFHGKGRVTAAGADAYIDKLAKRFLGIDKYPYRRPTEKRLIVRIEVDG